ASITQRSVPSQSEYLQKQALLDQPLSLDDLLRDDLDEGPLPIAGSQEITIDEGTELTADRGGVIDYDDDLSTSPPPRSPRTKEIGQRSSRPRNRHRPKERDYVGKHFGKRPSGENREKFEARPRESFGKKRSGKRIFGPREEGRGPAGEKAGNFRFR